MNDTRTVQSESIRLRKRLWIPSLLGCAILLLLILMPESSRNWLANVVARKVHKQTLADRLQVYEAPVRTRLADDFRRAGVDYYPSKMTLLALKHERRVELWCFDRKAIGHHVKSYAILAASGTLGPKLRVGDCQVSEGFYSVESLNPNSAFHLALRLNYPNSFDRAMAANDKRQNLGSDIMIHGSNVSVGCLPLGDEAAEDLFVLAARIGLENVAVIIAPVDLRKSSMPRESLLTLPTWTSGLYDQLRAEMRKLQHSAAAIRGETRAGEPRRRPFAHASPTFF